MRLDALWRAAGLPEASLEPKLASIDVNRVQADSRRVVAGDVFVAIDGLRARGLDFAPAALAAGAALVVHDAPDASVNHDLRYVAVDDARAALGALVSASYGHPSRGLKIAAITGTNGKTTSAILCAQLLHEAGLKAAAIGTVGVWTPEGLRPGGLTTPDPTDLHAMFATLLAEGFSAVVIEASSHALDQGRLIGVDIDAAAWTNLSHDHLDYHGDLQSYADAKRLLFSEHLQPGAPSWVNVDQPFGLELVSARLARGFTLAHAAEASVQGTMESHGREGMCVQLRDPEGQCHRLEAPLLGLHNAQNLVVAGLMASSLGAPWEVIAQAAPRLCAPPGRLEPVAAPGQGLTLVDYAHTPEALEAALEVGRGLCGPRGRLWTVFGCGGDRDQAKRAPMGEVAGRLADCCVVTSDNPRSEEPLAIVRDVVPGLEAAGSEAVDLQTLAAPDTRGYVLEVDRERAIRHAVRWLRHDDVLLIAGKGHEKTQTFVDRVVPFDDVEVAAMALRRRQELGGFTFTADQAADATSGDLVQDSGQLAALTLTTDSRAVPEGALFVALVGERFDGHQFIDQVVQAGATGVVCGAGSAVEMSRGWLVEVPDTLVALGDLALAHRKRFEGPVVCITGSNGKTSTKELTSLALGGEGAVLATYRNHNNRIGVPQTLARLRADHHVAVVECGMSIPGEIAELGRIAAPDVAVITNVGAAHLEGLGSVEAVAQEKTDLLRALGPGGVAIVPSDCDLVAPHLAGLPCRVFRFGPSGDVTLDGQVQIDGMTQRFRVRTPTTVVNVSLPALGVHMVTNTLAALAVAEVLGFDLQRAAARIAGFSPVGQRMRPLQLGDLLVLEDCYNANPSSMSAAITTLSSLPGPHVAVLGDMLELGPEAAALHAQVGHEAAAAGVHWVLARGQFASDTVRGALAAGGQGSVFDDDLAMATAILAAAPNGGTVLVKGSRGARMERVIEALKGERHGSEGGGRVPMAL